MPRGAAIALVVTAAVACLVWGFFAFAIAALGHIEEPATTGEVIAGAVTAAAGIVSIALAAWLGLKRRWILAVVLVGAAAGLFVIWLEVGVEPTRQPVDVQGFT